MEGWIKLHRKLSDNPIWTSEPFSRGQAFVDLILLASHKDSFFYKRGVKVVVKRGQLAWGENSLSQRWGWSRNKLRKFLNDLKKVQQIEQQKSQVITVITIVNYGIYQEKGTTEGTTEGQQTIQQKVQQKDTYKNVKKGKKVKNENNVKETSVKFSTDIENCYTRCLVFFEEHLRPKKNSDVFLWKDTIRKLFEIEKITPEKIIEIVEFTRSTDFWGKNFLSLSKLRKKNRDGIMYIVVFNEQMNKNGKKQKSAKEIFERAYNSQAARDFRY